MHIAGKGRRAVLDLCVAFGIGISLVLLNVAINYIDSLHDVLAYYSSLYVTDWLVNFLFFWLAILLWLAFRKWRGAARRGAELENVISSISPDTLLVVDLDRTITMCSASIKRAFGYTPQEIANKKTDLLYHDRRRDKDFHPHEVHEALQRDGFHIGRATGLRKGGEAFPLEIIAGELSGRKGAVLLLRDVTERIEADKKRRELEARIRQRQKLESLGMLAGGIAHDFNNLLTVMLGNSELAMMTPSLDAEARKNVEAIATAGRQAAGLCSQMLAYAGKGRLSIKQVDLSQVAHDTIRMLEVSIPPKTQLELKLGEQLPTIEGDPVQIQQVIMNLVINAGDAVGSGYGTIGLTTGVQEYDKEYLAGCTIDARLAAGRYAFLAVADTGCGMDEEVKAKIFDPFFTTKTSGRGLGLASVFGIIRGHRGALHVQSKPGEGTTFTALFPVGQTR